MEQTQCDYHIFQPNNQQHYLLPLLSLEFQQQTCEKKENKENVQRM